MPVYDILASTDYDSLSPPQKQAQLVLFYSNEIFNGGHLQYFHNHGLARADALLAALAALGAAGHRAIFAEALAYARAHPVEQVNSLEDYSERASEQEFRRWDDLYYAIEPDLCQGPLDDFVLANLGDFAIID